MKSLINFLGSGFSLSGSSPGLSSGSLSLLGKSAEWVPADKLVAGFNFNVTCSYSAAGELEVSVGERCRLQTVQDLHNLIGIVHADPFQVPALDVPEGLNDVGELRVLILMGEVPVSLGGIPRGFTLNVSSSFAERVKNVG